VILGSYHHPITENRPPSIFENKRRFEKIELWKKTNITFICPSKWVQQQFVNTGLLKKTVVIPNGINTELFHDMSATEDFMLVGAQQLKNKTKGMDLLVEALRLVDKKTPLHVFGVGKLPITDREVTYHGKITDKVQLAKLYSRAKVTLVPSRMETFGLVAAESMACGTPVVAFENTGIADIIDSGVDGWLAKSLSADDFAKGIKYVFNLSPSNYELLNERSRVKICSKFDRKLVGQKLYELYLSKVD
jgi:glycosyltransferase involved in cell wall biosynthesis